MKKNFNKWYFWDFGTSHKFTSSLQLTLLKQRILTVYTNFKVNYEGDFLQLIFHIISINIYVQYIS